MTLMELARTLTPLHRTLNSDGTDAALNILRAEMPEPFWIEEYAVGAQVWDWTVPPRYQVREAYIEDAAGRLVVDFAANPLHLVSYSEPLDTTMTGEQLARNVWHGAAGIPWKYSYYTPGWGFCMSGAQELDPAAVYRVKIDAERTDAPMRAGVGIVHPEGGQSGRGEILITSHIDHPAQANDGISGVLSALSLARRLAKNPLPFGSLSVRFVFCAETIGMIAYLAHNEKLIPRLKGGIVLEMTGTSGPLCLHYTRQGETLLDNIASRALPIAPRRDFAAHPANDERILNAPGVDVPTINLNRWPYSEYHTSADSADILSEAMLEDAAASAERVVRIFASDYTPRLTQPGPVMLSKHGLFVDWKTDWKANRLNEAVMLNCDGTRTVWQIAHYLDEDYWKVRAICEQFRVKGLLWVVK